MELRIPFARDRGGRPIAKLALFADVGRAWNERNDDPSPTPISSAGVGVRWDPTTSLHADLYGAVQFRDVEGLGGDSDLQDDGVHFRVSYQRLF